ncbi:MAG: cysteine-rich small domain-containing protein [Lachnospiraceae bacterium]|nr:cysteine-rich small domain-containing protein [Lachnospiraceae bacterium]
MQNSSRFFANRECEYYPCHKTEEDLNCLFCYCPLYNLNCPGNFEIIEKGDRKIKSCLNCVFPHRAENYDRIMDMLKEQNRSKTHTDK